MTDTPQSPAPVGDEIENLRDQLAAAEIDNRRLCDKVADLEQRCTNVAKLYAASCRLLGARDGNEWVTSIQEILVNIVGTEQLALVQIAEPGKPRVLLSMDVAEDRCLALLHSEGPVKKAIESGRPFVAKSPLEPHTEPDGLCVTAAIPMTIDGAVKGAVLVMRMLPQKKELTRLDREIYDLIGNVGARALEE